MPSIAPAGRAVVVGVEPAPRASAIVLRVERAPGWRAIVVGVGRAPGLRAIVGVGQALGGRASCPPGVPTGAQRWGFICLAALLAVVGCQPDTKEAESPAEVEEPLAVVTEEGPVKATVTLSPPTPRLGDSLVLTLTVAAEAGVVVEMPAFGEALGRFAIVDFTPREEVASDGASMASQRYTLEAPLSGRHRIPRLRIEYRDERASASEAQTRELLTDELSFIIESVLPEGTVADTLLPMRAPLEDRPARVAYWGASVAIGLAGFAALAIWLWRRRRALETLHERETAFERAMQRLERLELQGVPDDAAAGPWYVELSDIVRRYIEERLAVRAPELTTEEFLREAGRNEEFSQGHRDLLADFLERCDRVKFAAHRPGAEESRRALEAARRFLGETRDAVAVASFDQAVPA